jgi:uncharacterized membrane protein
MDIERSIDIVAPPSAVWAVMSDVERWPEWTASISSVELLDGAPFAVGSRARIQQPRLPTAVWTITAVEPERYFEWQTSGPGVKTVAGHRIETSGSDGSRLTLSLEWSGLLAPLIRLLYGGMSRNYVSMEAQGLKQRSEGAENPTAR